MVYGVGSVFFQSKIQNNNQAIKTANFKAKQSGGRGKFKAEGIKC